MGVGKREEFLETIDALKDSAIIVVVDKDRDALEGIEIPERRMAVVLGRPVEDLFNIFGELWFRAFEDAVTYIKVAKYIWCDESMEDPYYHKAAQLAAQAMLDVRSNFANEPYDSLLGLRNMLRNLDIIANNPGINTLKDRFKGRPAVCVATGPSLDKNIDLLKDLEERAVIVTCDASLKPLLDHGIKPHLVTCLERTHGMRKYFDCVRDRLKGNRDIFFAGTPVINRVVFESFEGPKFIPFRNFAHFRWLPFERGILPIGPSAGNMSFRIAHYLGCSPIILVGQDLAYGPGGVTHASDRLQGPGSMTGPYKQENLIWLMGNNGKPIPSDGSWARFKTWFEKELAEEDIDCINATEGGAFIRGSRVMMLEDALAEYCTEEFHPRKTMLEVQQEFDPGDDYQETLEKSVGTLNGCLRIMRLCEDAVKTCEKFKAKWQPCMVQDDPPDLAQLKADYTEIIQFTADIKADNETFGNFLLHVLQSYVVTFTADVHLAYEYQDKPWKQDILVAMSHRHMFEVVGRLTERCYEVLRKEVC